MKAKDIEGRRVVKINQTRMTNENTGRPLYHLESLVLDNGTILVFSVSEGPGEYYIEATAYKNGSKEGDRQ